MHFKHFKQSHGRDAQSESCSQAWRHVPGNPASRAQPWPHRETLSKQWVVMARGSTKQLLRYWNLKLRREGSTEDEHAFGNQSQKGCI